MLESISSQQSYCRQMKQTAAQGFKGQAAAASEEAQTPEQPTTTTIVEADGCKMLVIKKGAFVTMKINLGNADVEAPETAAEKNTAAENCEISPAALQRENQYLQNDVTGAGLASGMLFVSSV